MLEDKSPLGKALTLRSLGDCDSLAEKKTRLEPRGARLRDVLE